MKIAIISDIHSNLTALERALEAIHGRNVHEIYCLGDIVGYCAEPGPCVDLVRETCTGVVMGNHDEAVALDRNIDWLPKDGQTAIYHNRAQLSPDQLDYLANLPLRITEHNCTFAHATPQTPEQWLRIGSYHVMQAQFEHFDTDFCFIGHTHIPGLMADRIGVFSVQAGHRYIINAGSIGQPRDRNPMLSFVVLDTETPHCEFVRVPYSTERTAEKILDAGLPTSLAKRIKRGV